MLAATARDHRWILGLIAFAYLYVSPYFPIVNNPNENVRFYMTIALVEEGRYEIDGPRHEWGWVNDAARLNGHLYSVKAPGTSFLAVPGYAAYLSILHALDHPYDRATALRVCRLTAVVFPTLFFLWWFRRFLSRDIPNPALRDSVLVSVALGSLLYPYGLLLVSHTLSAAAAFGAFMCLRTFQGDRARRPALTAFVAGLCTAGVTLFEYPGLICSVALALLGVWRLRSAPRLLLPFAAGGLGPTLAMMHFQWQCFGSPWTPGHLWVESAKLRSQHHEGLYGAVGVSAEALDGLLLDPARGLLPLTPLLVLAPLGLIRLLRTPERRADALTALFAAGGTILAISAMNNWRGGWSIGPRYLATIVPFLGWAAGCELQAWHRRMPAGAIMFAVGTTCAGVIASGAIGAYYPHLPPEIARPVSQLLPTLIAHDYAPSNAANLIGVYGSISMLPLLLAALALPVLLLRGAPRPAALALGAGLVCALAVGPVLRVPPEATRGPGGRSYVTRRWYPQGHDLASRLGVELVTARGPARKKIANEIRDIYLSEGRNGDALKIAKGQLPAVLRPRK